MRRIPSVALIGAVFSALLACGDDGNNPPGNILPIADAGPDQSVGTVSSVTLDGSGSSDAENSVLTHAWSQVSGPVMALDNPAAVQPTFRTPRQLVSLEFSLTVSDSEGTSLPDRVTIAVDSLAQVIVADGVSPAISDTEKPGKLAAITAGLEILIVSCRTTGSPSGIFGTVVDTSGAVLRTIPIASHDCSFPRPSIARLGTGFVVVFQRNAGIVATRLGAAPGFPVLGENVISGDGSNWAPVVASGSLGAFVAWASYRNLAYDIYGTVLSAAGTAGTEIPIFTETGEQVEPAIAFDGTNYLVVWRDTRSGSGPMPDTDIYGTRVSEAGAVLDPAGIAISSAPGIQGSPQLAFDGTNYLAVWSDGRRNPLVIQPTLDIIGTRVSPAGALLDGSAATGGIAICTAETAAGVTTNPSPVFDGTNYLVAFSVEGFAPPSGVYLARVSPAGTLLDRPPAQFGPSLSGVHASTTRLVYPVAAVAGTSTIVAWVDNVELAGSSKRLVGVVMERQGGGPALAH